MATISVLYVEDDEDDFIILNELFKHFHHYSEDDVFELVWAKNITEGIRKYIRGNFDICLLDYQLGGDDAHEFLSCVRLYMKSTPIIILTNRDELSLDINLMKYGVRAFLPKPDVSLRLLETTIRHVLESAKHIEIDVHASRPWNPAETKHLLCIEDDVEDYEILRDNLLNITTAHYHAKHVMTLKEGLEEYLGGNYYDACLLDYKLGKNNALEMLYRLEENVGRIPIIMITGCNDPELDIFATELGVDAFLRKEEITSDRLERTLRYVTHYAAGAA